MLQVDVMQAACIDLSVLQTCQGWQGVCQKACVDKCRCVDMDRLARRVHCSFAALVCV